MARNSKIFSAIDQKMFERAKKIIEPAYMTYVREVSSPNMATSLELAALQYAICKANSYTKLLDMGSGLSSFVFRLYAKENPGVTVFSVDDDEAWLQKTKLFLIEHGLNTDNILLLDEFLKSKENEFDFILHDLNFVEVRINFVELMLRTAQRNGLLIFDDVHKPDYLFSLLSILKKEPVHIYDLKPVTIDSFGRYALAVVKG